MSRMNRFRSLGSLGANATVLVVAIAVFVVAFLGLTAYGNSVKPDVVRVMVLNRDVNPGEVLQPADLQPAPVFADALTKAYVREEEAGDVVGKVVLVPQRTGQPLLKGSVLAPSSVSERLAGILEEGHTLFPLPLSNNNVVAPRIEDFYPGDHLMVTIVVEQKPTSLDLNQFGTTAQPTPTPVPVYEEAVELGVDLSADLARVRPPVAKILNPKGVRVVAVYGKPMVQPVSTDGEGDTAAQPVIVQEDDPLLLLDVPVEEAEALAFALAKGDAIFVSIIGRVDAQPDHTVGFTYDDFEKLLTDERAQAILQKLIGGDEGAEEAQAPQAPSEPEQVNAPSEEAPEPEPEQISLTADEFAVVVSLAGTQQAIADNAEAVALVSTRGLSLLNDTERVNEIIATLQEKGVVGEDGRTLADPIRVCLVDGGCTISVNGEVVQITTQGVEQ